MIYADQGFEQWSAKDRKEIIFAGQHVLKSRIMFKIWRQTDELNIALLCFNLTWVDNYLTAVKVIKNSDCGKILAPTSSRIYRCSYNKVRYARKIRNFSVKVCHA